MAPYAAAAAVAFGSLPVALAVTLIACGAFAAAALFAVSWLFVALLLLVRQTLSNGNSWLRFLGQQFRIDTPQAFALTAAKGVTRKAFTVAIAAFGFGTSAALDFFCMSCTLQ